MKKTEAKKILNKICEKYSIFEIRSDGDDDDDKFLRVFSVTDYGGDAFMCIDNDDMRVMLFLPYPLKEITPSCKTFSCTSISYNLMSKNKYTYEGIIKKIDDNLKKYNDIKKEKLKNAVNEL